MSTELGEKKSEPIFFISDTHFGHRKILTYIDRPFSDCEVMDQELITRWNSVVPENGLVYHLGDFALPFNDKTSLRERFQHYFQQLNGKIVLIKGNHDRYLYRTASESGVFCSRQGYPVYLCDSFYHWCLIEDVSGSYHVHMTHKPMHPRLHKKMKRDEFDVFLHGHEHGNSFPAPPDYLDLSVELHNYTPVSFEQIIKLIKKKRKKHAK